MCGIVGYAGERECVDVLLDSLSKLEYRGYDSAGIAVFEKGSIVVEKTQGKLSNLREKLDNREKINGHCEYFRLDNSKNAFSNVSEENS